MSRQPWASGPSEILQHGLALLHKDSDKNRRLAFLSIDNAVELTIKTYLSLPQRVTGIKLSRSKFSEISESFPLLLDALEEYASPKLSGIDLGEIEWYHRLRNQLYHQGNGLTVDRDKVEVYAQLGKLLFKNLFGFEVEVDENDGYELLGSFLEAWTIFEKATADLSEKNKDKLSTLGGRTLPPLIVTHEFYKLGLIDAATQRDIESLRQIRNEVIHGKSDHRKVLTPDLVKRVNVVTSVIQQLL